VAVATGMQPDQFDVMPSAFTNGPKRARSAVIS
jgi:hypothetical protein